MRFQQARFDREWFLHRWTGEHQELLTSHLRLVDNLKTEIYVSIPPG